jgi:hypothetical protein
MQNLLIVRKSVASIPPPKPGDHLTANPGGNVDPALFATPPALRGDPAARSPAIIVEWPGLDSNRVFHRS